MKEKKPSKFLQKGFIQLPIIAVAVLIVAAVTLPVVSSFIAQNKKITTQQRATGADDTTIIGQVTCPSGTSVDPSAVQFNYVATGREDVTEIIKQTGNTTGSEMTLNWVGLGRSAGLFMYAHKSGWYLDEMIPLLDLNPPRSDGITYTPDSTHPESYFWATFTENLRGSHTVVYRIPTTFPSYSTICTSITNTPTPRPTNTPTCIPVGGHYCTTTSGVTTCCAGAFCSGFGGGMTTCLVNPSLTSTPTPTRVLTPTPTPTSASCLSISSCSGLYARGQAALNKSCGDAAYDKVVDFDKNRIVNNADAHEFALHCRDLNWCANRLADTTDPCVQTTPTPTIPAACQVATTISLKFCYGQCTSCENACGAHACIRVFHPAGAPADPDCVNYGSTTIEYWAFKCTDTLPKSVCSCANLPTGNPTGNPTANPTPPNTTITPQATITPGGSCAVPTPIVEPGGWCYGVCANCETNCLGGTKACRFYQDCWGGAGGYRCTTNLSRQTCSGCGGANPTPPNTTVTPQATVTPGGLTPTPTRGAGCNSCPAGGPARNRGNADCNSTIDADDLSLWYNQFLDNKTPSQTNSADFFCDGVVDESDLAIWYSNANIWTH